MNRVVALILLAVLTSGCYRTVYSHLTPPISEQTGLPPRGEVAPPEYGWHHFFFWGVDPPEVVVEAGKMCGGAAYVDRIETKQTLLQGMLEDITSYYVNIYSPYNGKVICKPVAAPAAPAAP